MRLIIRPLIVIIAAAAVLAAPPRANAAGAPPPNCNKWVSANCENWEPEDFDTACDILCPEWWAAACDGAGDHVMCISNPE